MMSEICALGIEAANLLSITLWDFSELDIFLTISHVQCPAVAVNSYITLSWRILEWAEASLHMLWEPFFFLGGGKKKKKLYIQSFPVWKFFITFLQIYSMACSGHFYCLGAQFTSLFFPFFCFFLACSANQLLESSVTGLWIGTAA